MNRSLSSNIEGKFLNNVEDDSLRKLERLDIFGALGILKQAWKYQCWPYNISDF